MDRFFRDGLAVDSILVFMVVEVIVLILIRTNGARVFRPTELIVTVGAGASLLLALRAALQGLVWQRVAVWLVVALAFHVCDLALRGSMHRTR